MPPSPVFVIFFLIIAILINISLISAFAISAYKSFKTRHAGWIISTCITGTIIALVSILFIAATWNRIYRQNAATPGKSSALNGAQIKQITGNKVAYKISVPSNWRITTENTTYDTRIDDNHLFIGILCEGAFTPDTNALARSVIENLNKQEGSVEYGAQNEIIIDGKIWRTIDATIKSKKFTSYNRYYLYADKDGAYEITAVCPPHEFAGYEAFINKTISTFKFPQAPFTPLAQGE